MCVPVCVCTPGVEMELGRATKTVRQATGVAESSLTLLIPLCIPGLEMQLGRATKSLRQVTESLSQASISLYLYAPGGWKCSREERPSR
jgi:hypothetical protein